MMLTILKESEELSSLVSTHSSNVCNFVSENNHFNLLDLYGGLEFSNNKCSHIIHSP